MMFSAFLFIHSWLRWAVVILGIIAVFRAFNGVMGDKPFTDGQRKTNVLFVMSTHLNVVFGLVLYAVFSPTAQRAFSDMGAAMKDSRLRFFAVEHLMGMLIAAVLITVGSVKSKNAEGDKPKHKAVLVFMGIGFLVMLASIPWPFRNLGAGWISMPF